MKLYFSLIKKLFNGFRKSSYEYLKAYLVFPLIYGRLTNRNIEEILKKKKTLKKYLEDGIIVEKFSEKECILISKTLIKNNILIKEINTQNDPRFHIKLSSQNYPELVNLIKNILKKYHFEEISKLQLKRKKVRLEELYLFIQDTSKGWRDEIEELKDGSRTKTRYFHVDSSPKNKFTKFIIYLNDITDKNGPFEYISKSHNLDKFPYSFFRRINHHSRIQDLSINSRKYFSLLPTFLQKKAEVGNDIDNNDWEFDSKVYEGKAGTVILFNNSGLHRGGLNITKRRITIHGGYR